MSAEVVPVLDPGRENSSGPVFFDAMRYLRFGAFILDQHRQELFRNGTRSKLQGKTYQVLRALLERPGEVVTREELRERLWSSGTHINFDANVNTTMNKLRQALGDSPHDPLYIETIPRKGYCFVATVEPSEAPATLRPAYPEAAPPLVERRFSAKDSPGRGTKHFPTWTIVRIAALIAAGMLVGAGIATFWLSHLSQVSSLR